MIVDYADKIISSLGLVISFVSLYLIGTFVDEKLERTNLPWTSFSLYFTISACIFSLISFIEALEFLSTLMGVELESFVHTLNLVAGVVMLFLTLSLVRIFIKGREDIVTLGSHVFYGKFGITMIYIAVFLISVDRIAEIESIYYFLKILTEILFIAFLPLFVYIIIRSRRYNMLIKKGLIIVPPHTVNIFLGVVTSFTVFYISLLMHSVGNEKIYNLLEIGSLFAFVLVGFSYSEEMEKLLKIAESP